MPSYIDSRGRERTTHGHARAGQKSATYNTWIAMTARCYNPNIPDFQKYGARGITVCNRWRHSFENFLADMGERPAGRTIDRINNNRGYTPSNCRWATKSEQCRNTRQTKLTVEKVAKIRKDIRSNIAIGKELGVSNVLISMIKRGKIWK